MVDMKFKVEAIFPMLYFKCSEGHFTPCQTGARLIYCKPCDKILEKKDCERYTDTPFTKLVYRRSRGGRVPFGNKTLYKFTDSVRRNYRKNPSTKKGLLLK